MFTNSYLGQRPNAKDGSSHPPILPPRRLSNRLRGVSSGHHTPSREANMQKPTVESPSAMEIDSPILLPNASRMTNSSAATLIPYMPTSPRSGMEAQVEATKESSVYVSSYTGSICIGLYGLEPKHVFKGASTLSGLMDGLGEAKKLLRDRIGHQPQMPTSSPRHFV
ncbi:hypothetical protein QFC19_007856 [Naganishia cerealis]|uniref:Uncharacterized protein n=1 Tax=Naganishia cerealis TaxID=610337 RepID=A0ACC2V5L2_9TREE|nr:hypothetical protein QFC19_007856 [Naganishia cerealis]